MGIMIMALVCNFITAESEVTSRTTSRSSSSKDEDKEGGGAAALQTNCRFGVFWRSGRGLREQHSAGQNPGP